MKKVMAKRNAIQRLKKKKTNQYSRRITIKESLYLRKKTTTIWLKAITYFFGPERQVASARCHLTTAPLPHHRTAHHFPAAHAAPFHPRAVAPFSPRAARIASAICAECGSYLHRKAVTVLL